MIHSDQMILREIDEMSTTLASSPEKEFCGPTQFWRELCNKHIEFLKEYGFDNFKRSINFEYHQWGVSDLGNEQVRHLLKGLISKRKIPYVALLSRFKNSYEWPLISKRRALAYRIYLGLLWQYARCEDELGVLRACEEPLVGRPLEITYGGRLISQDLAISSLELNRIARAVDLSKVCTVAEIGAGYGRLAYVFKKMNASAEYNIFDIPPAMAISQNYLARTLGKESVSMFGDHKGPDGGETGSKKVIMHLPFDIKEFPDRYFDLFINISSFDEMTREQVEYYFDMIDKKCKGLLYLKGYAARDGSDPNRPMGLEQFPYRPTWKKVYDGVDTVHPRFIERIYDLSR